MDRRRRYDPSASSAHDVPFVALAFLLGLVGVAGGMAQAATGHALETALGSTGPAMTAATVFLLGGAGAGAALARGKLLQHARALLVGGTILVVLAAMELALPRVWVALVRWPLSLRALVGAPLLLLPALVTGLILPILARSAARDARGSRRISALLGCGFAGSALGAAASACALLPVYGADLVARVAAMGCALIGASIAALAWRWPRTGLGAPNFRPFARDRRATVSRPLAVGAVALGMLTGASVATAGHLARVVTGGADDAFAAWFAGTLAGLAAGAAAAGSMRLHYRDAASPRAISAAAATLVLTTWFWGVLPGALRVAGTFLHTAQDLAFAHLAAAALTCALPGAWLGAAFQLLLPRDAEEALRNRSSRPPEPAPHEIAGAGAAGAALGAALTALVLIPLIGSRRTLVAVAFLLATLGIIFAWRTRARRSALSTALATAILAAVLPRWGTTRLAVGADGVTTLWTRESVGAGAVAVTPNAIAVNGRLTTLDPNATGAAQLAALYAPRLDRAAALDDLAVGSALLQSPWANVATPYVTAAWLPNVPAPLRPALDDPRATRLRGRGEDAFLRTPAFDAVLATLPPACGPGCARALVSACRRALAEDGVAVFATGSADGAPLLALARAVRTIFGHAALVGNGGPALVLASAHPLEIPAGRADLLKTTPTPLVAADTSFDACMAEVAIRGDASAATLGSCPGGAVGAQVVSR